MKGRQLGDPRNENLLAWVGDRLLPRELAKVSVFDSAVQGGGRDNPFSHLASLPNLAFLTLTVRCCLGRPSRV